MRIPFHFRTGVASLRRPRVQDLRIEKVPHCGEQRHLLREDTQVVLGGARGLLERTVCQATAVHHRQLAAAAGRIRGVEPHVSGMIIRLFIELYIYVLH